MERKTFIKLTAACVAAPVLILSGEKLGSVVTLGDMDIGEETWIQESETRDLIRDGGWYDMDDLTIVRTFGEDY